MEHTFLCESVNGKQTCEALPNEKPVSSNDGADHSLSQSVYDSLDAYQILPKGAQGDSDLTAKAISSQGVSVGMSTSPLGEKVSDLRL